LPPDRPRPDATSPPPRCTAFSSPSARIRTSRMPPRSRGG
jgi:hypothetical protein